MTIEIEKGIPIPNKSKSWTRYPWDELEVGDSFLVKNKKTAGLSSTASVSARRYGKKFTMRQVGPDVRVWRIA